MHFLRIGESIVPNVHKVASEQVHCVIMLKRKTNIYHWTVILLYVTLMLLGVVKRK